MRKLLDSPWQTLSICFVDPMTFVHQRTNYLEGDVVRFVPISNVSTLLRTLGKFHDSNTPESIMPSESGLAGVLTSGRLNHECRTAHVAHAHVETWLSQAISRRVRGLQGEVGESITRQEKGRRVNLIPSVKEVKTHHFSHDILDFAVRSSIVSLCVHF